MKTTRNLFGKLLHSLGLAIVFALPTLSFADGCFVAPKFVWDKHKDINEPTQKAILVYDAGREDMVLQVKYEGPADEFGWLIPVPSLPTVQDGSMKCFYELSQYTQKQFEPQWQYNRASMSKGGHGLDEAADKEPPVKVVEIKTVGAYKIAVLSTKDVGALANWLATNQYYFPTNKTDVLDAYVQQQWYFVAVKIALDKSLFGPAATANQLASGELKPLQISFDSDRCVYPLKISSANGRPSEVQVYVLSPEPLLEKTMLKLPLMYSNDMARAEKLADSMRESDNRRKEMMMRMGALGPPTDSEQDLRLKKMRETPEAAPEELLPSAKVTNADLPDSSKWLPRLAKKSWWLTKQTWTFQPEEMHDLKFEPAIPVLSELLGSKYGYFAVSDLASLGADALPALLRAFQSDNRLTRINAAAVLENERQPISDPRLTEAAAGWLKDSEPEVRTAAVRLLTDESNWKPEYADVLIASLRDGDAGVIRALVHGLARHGADMTNHVPAIQAMLQDKDARVRASAVKMLFYLQVPVQRDISLALLSVPDRELFGLVAQQYRHPGPDGRLQYEMSNDEAAPLFQNPDPLGRLIGLNVIYHNANKQSVEMALPLLNDSDQAVRTRAAATLRALTGQHFTDAEPDQWEKWWTANKANFVVELHPEELRPQRFRPSAGGPVTGIPR